MTSNVRSNDKNDTVRSQASQTQAPKQGPLDYIGEVKAELFRITWSSKEEVQVYTKIVVAATFVLGMGIYLADLTINNCLAGLGVIFRFITG